MVTDAIASANIHAASSPKDFGKKKRTNRTAKLKQCKLDARREQWLSQVNGKGKEKSNGGSDEIRVLPMHARGEKHSVGNLETSPRGEENDGLSHHYSDSDSPSNSPISSSSLLSSKNSGTNFSSSSSSSSGGSCSGNISEEDGDDGCLDDWEAVADALAVTDKQHTASENERVVQSDPPRQATNRSVLGVDHPKQDCGARVPRAPGGGRAWRADDALRPTCLPNLSKQHSFPANSDRHFVGGGVPWACNNAISAPMSCPICYEDLDVTDSSFLPCSCGFRLCLFCHKRILEEDGRCPGCRKQYHYDTVQGEPSLNGGSLTFRLTRSCSMVTRS